MAVIAIIGAGASGMAAAIKASENNENRILLFERQQRVGKKLLTTGNGRCNLTNTGANVENYHGQNPKFVIPAMTKEAPEQVLDFFKRLGLVTVEEYGGRVYPLSNSANSVLDVLRFALEKDNIELLTEKSVLSVIKSGKGFVIETENEKYTADKVIVACGGCAGSKQGGVKDGYEILKSLGHKRTGLFPSLVQLTTDPEYPKALKGVRAQAKLTLSGCAEGESVGEIQFTEKGVSGPATFDISRNVATSGDGKKQLHINFLYDANEYDVRNIIVERIKNNPHRICEEILVGIVHNRLAKMIVKYAGLSGNNEIGNLKPSDVEKIMNACTDFTIQVKGTEGFDSAQVTAGGVETSQFNPETMESRIVPGLYACGEVLDIDGDCGGYNLQWAWASGITAGGLN